MITIFSSNKQYFMHRKYTYCYRSKARGGFRWRCTNTSDCKAYVILSADGSSFTAYGIHSHNPPNYHILPNGTLVQEITMTSGKRYKYIYGYTYGAPVPVKGGLKYRCTRGCELKLIEMDNGRVYYLYDGYTYTYGYKSRKGGTFLWTKRGVKHPLLLLDGFTYSYQKQNANGRVSWYCSRRLKGCRASAISIGDKAYAYKPHDHPPPKRQDSTADIKPLQSSYLFFGIGRRQQQHQLHELAGSPGEIPRPHRRQASSESNSAFRLRSVVPEA
ncbi:hypothetical protein RR48_05214 [Papilio machaon]|uniref:FLYWCH-type domain-containing protein n=1 Tax=Papilio machaon TaxID=76193 RepID=A0A0N0PCJ8_PAPMA|nr:hypothetical protein RR48_05214 [Papilio machaon]